MISHIAGILEHKDKDFLTVDVSGVGYKIFAPASTLSRLPTPGEKVKLFTEQIVREDYISLFGFYTKEERNLFVNLLTVNGVGPKGALSIVSSFPIDKLVAAIAQGNADLLTSVPGIGNKTAQRIIIELKEKLAKIHGLRGAGMEAGVKGDSTDISDAIAALVTLGYSPREAREAIMKTGSEGRSVEGIIKAALKNLS